MPQSFESYSKMSDPEGGSASFDVDLKWSLWSADVETWQERAPEVLAHMYAMYENTLYLKLAPKKEIRYGNVTITGTSECEDAPGDLTATGRFESHWDDGTIIFQAFTIHATSVAEMLALIDKEEEELIENSKS